MRALISAPLPAGSSCTRVHSRPCTKITAGRAAPPRAIAAPAILTGVAGGAIISEAESIVLGEKFLEAGADVECDVSAADADCICWEFIHQDPLIQSMGKTKKQVVDMTRSCTFTDELILRARAARDVAAPLQLTSRAARLCSVFFVNNHVCLCWKSPFTFVELNVLRHAMGPRQPCGRHARRAFHFALRFSCPVSVVA